ncbi:hypothetical protein Btru_050093 [Bulinus truncatus]|nr:hypothetical protein Btru_050093 [Bulinus truncatus]
MRTTELVGLLIVCGLLFTQECSVGWFGDRCQYKCHYSNNSTCNVTDQWTDLEPCERGWFDFKCQYRDLAVDGNLTIMNTAQPVINTLTDANDTTCFDHDRMFTVKLTWNAGFLFTRLRIVVKQVDFSCDVLEPVQQIIIDSLGAASLCSIYVNGESRADQQLVKENTAGQGSRRNSNSSIQCSQLYTLLATMTYLPNGRYPLMQISLSRDSVVFNRGDCCSERLINFRMQTLDDENNVLFNYTDPQTKALFIYTINYNSTNPIRKIHLFPGREFLTLCEVEIYGVKDGPTLLLTGMLTTSQSKAELHCYNRYAHHITVKGGPTLLLTVRWVTKAYTRRHTEAIVLLTTSRTISIAGLIAV